MSNGAVTRDDQGMSNLPHKYIDSKRQSSQKTKQNKQIK